MSAHDVMVSLADGADVAMTEDTVILMAVFDAEETTGNTLQLPATTIELLTDRSLSCNTEFKVNCVADFFPFLPFFIFLYGSLSSPLLLSFISLFMMRRPHYLTHLRT